MKSKAGITRRSVLRAGLALPISRSLGHIAPAVRAKRLLVLGGTRFLGPAIVRAALDEGWDVTLFNRGKSNPDMLRQVEQIVGDRDTGNLGALKDRTWDACVDTCGYVSRQVQQSCELLRDAVQHYVFVSTVSVYADQSAPVVDESTAAALPSASEIAAARTIQQGMANYAPMKAACEVAAERAMPGRVTIVRSPSLPDAEVQLVDVRDLGSWCFRMAAANTAGIMNAVGFRGMLSFAELLGGCKVLLNTEASFTWADEQFLFAKRLRPYMDLPLWLPHGKFGHIDNRKATAAGLTFRPVAQTIQDTLNWALSRPKDYEWRSGLSAERERELLREWSARRR